MMSLYKEYMLSISIKTPKKLVMVVAFKDGKWVTRRNFEGGI